MSGKIFGVVIALVIVLLMAIALPAITGAVKSFRTDVISQDFTLSTAAGITTGNVTLSHALWNSDVTEVTRISSDNSTDSPVADNYTTSSKRLNLTGLAPNITRTLTVDYRSAGLSEYAGADQISTNIPGIVIGFAALIPLTALAALLISRR